ncbi:Malate/lactate dehydrogenase [Natronincola peptidivorans]|uniref:Malate/lactate dehydrogenase n=1 Tax=Natronincola peptidivorans TaxID=426128 RepID=A0A1I0EXJ9_9FIRM|nr:lactate dehydrogenase [Natronincola peptidivorans]SET50375.1 Malate/lactate dehydrogenase [Natronincola peptidivorans]
MYYYKHLNRLLFSLNPYKELQTISEDEVIHSDAMIYYLYSMNPKKSRMHFAVSHPSLLSMKHEGINLLQMTSTSNNSVPNWLSEKIEKKKVMAVNTAYLNWEKILLRQSPAKWRVNIAGLGDVGGTLLTGLRLIGGDCIDSIGIYDRNPEKLMRWYYEINQVYSPGKAYFPEIDCIDIDSLFDCDMFVFCIAKAVPPVGTEVKDVRMVQFQENAQIIKEYAKKARNKNFDGIFAVVSDPVDLLCKVVYNASNLDEKNIMDYRGLAPEQIRGYGLGVMHARALYYSKENPKTIHYAEEGRAFGPHGEDLVIADSIQHYNETLSQYLTNKTKTANIEVRKTGFKPYIAPALSSGSLSLLATIKGDWHYSATYMGGVYMGARNRLLPTGTEVELLELPDLLFKRLEQTYYKLEEMV